jgi:hypothetical protein
MRQVGMRSLSPPHIDRLLSFPEEVESNGRCVFRPHGKCYDEEMNVFVVLSMESCHESNVERPLCTERASFDWRGVSSALLEAVPSTC